MAGGVVEGGLEVRVGEGGNGGLGAEGVDHLETIKDVCVDV